MHALEIWLKGLCFLKKNTGPLTHELHALEVALKGLTLCPGQVRVGVLPLWTRISVPHVHCLLFS